MKVHDIPDLFTIAHRSVLQTFHYTQDSFVLLDSPDTRTDSHQEHHLILDACHRTSEFDMLLRAIFLAMALALTGPAQPSPVQLPNDPRDLSIRKPKPLPLAAPKLPPLPLPPPPPIPIAFPIPFRALDPTGARPEPQNLHHRVDDTTITGPQNITITPTTSSFPTALATVPGTNEQNFGKDKDKDTEDDLIDGKKGCAEFTVIFARGTTESGNVGTSTGPPFFASLKKVVGAENVAVQGVDYPADIPGFLEGGSPDGSATM